MNIPGNLKKYFFYRQHPDAALRYIPIVSLIKKNKWENKKILEIGSGSYGITPYLKKRITGLDRKFIEPEYHLLKQIKGSALNIPFKDNDFNIIILSDVLEHIKKVYRKKVLNEAIRVADTTVIVSGPFGEEAFAQDKKLIKYSKKVLKKIHPYFLDHLKFGLPEVVDIRDYLIKNSKVKKIKILGSYLNLKVREIIMRFFITKSKLKFYFYLKGLMFLIPILRRLNQKPCYRSLIHISLKN